MENLPLFSLLIGGIIMAFWLGRTITKSPSEETMLRELVRLRTQRMILSISEKEIKDEVAKLSDAEIKRARG